LAICYFLLFLPEEKKPMDQTILQQPKPGKSKLWIGCLLTGVIGFAGLAVLAGGAYYFGFFEPQETAVPSTPTEQVETATPEVLATVPPVTDLPQVTPTLVVLPPEVELYDPYLNVQYPSLATLADPSGNVTILPGQPTILDLRWCASGESTLSDMTRILDVTIMINDVEISLNSFNSSQVQTTLQITPEEKTPALCRVLTGLVRNWGNGEYNVKLSFRATAAYNDGWKDHAAGEEQEFIYNVNVTPSSSSVDWDRCQEFEDLKPELVFLDPQPNEPHGLYFAFQNGVPGLETEIAGDTDDWEYAAGIGDAVSDKPCIFQHGYDGRLYCKVQINSNYVRSVQPVTLSVNGCSWPVYLKDTQIP
jgi:hypothetical protein